MNVHYPKPPYPSPKQPMPGTTGKMDPRPEDPLAQLGLDAIDLRWTLKDIASKRK
jgi:hypothetical protein